jgi:hypothetical protein
MSACPTIGVSGITLMGVAAGRPLDQVAEGYKAVDEHCATKTLLLP